MLVWRGYGGLVPLIAFLSCLGGELITNNLAGAGYWDSHGYPLAMALFVASALIWMLDAHLFRHPGRTLIDAQTGEHVVLVPRHDFFFLRVKWWSVVCLASAVAVLAARGP